MDKLEDKVEEPLSKDEKRKMWKVSVYIIVIVLFLFAILMTITGLIGTYFGKTAENIVLVVIAIILVVMLYISKRS